MEGVFGVLLGAESRDRIAVLITQLDTEWEGLFCTSHSLGLMTKLAGIRRSKVSGE